MAVWICLNFTKPSPATNRSVTVSITNIRLAMNYSSSTSTSNGPCGNRHPSAANVQQHSAIHAMAVAGLLSEKRGRVILGPHGDEAIVAAQPPAARVPVEPASHV